MWKKLFVVLLISAGYFSGYTQSRFNLTDSYQEKVHFKLIDNLIIIPVTVNGVELSFLLDTGVSKAILFNLVNLADSLKINNVETIYLQGLGGGEPIEALKSKKNLFRIGNTINVNQDLFVILDETINFTPRLGFPVHGIIGYDLFKDFVVEINYSKRFLRFHDPRYYEYKKCGKCETLPLTFFNFKPYITAEVEIKDHYVPVKLLIDSGGSDALWLFDDKSLGIHLYDAPYFTDFLGLGLSGSVYGNRSKLKSFRLKSFELHNINVAYPDSTSISEARKFSERNGSIAGELLKRFNMIIDYPSSKITLQKNSLFKKPFLYNKSGLVLQQDGIRIVKVQNIQNLFPSAIGRQNNADDANSIIEIVKSYTLAVRPAIVIAEIRKESAAQKSGLKVGDIVIRVNGDDTSKYQLQEVISNFFDDDGKLITIDVDRNGILMRFKFRLENVLKQKDLQN
ncbi:PDZ domain (Also known as DHR or GLGF) [Flavobacteriaceae bacterium MAR_2010_188]|nr:PDZ domain (Also known as DHR or GLGF) [Flavobacteriaceae bacterium MAR_2010_188]